MSALRECQRRGGTPAGNRAELLAELDQLVDAGLLAKAPGGYTVTDAGRAGLALPGPETGAS